MLVAVLATLIGVLLSFWVAGSSRLWVLVIHLLVFYSLFVAARALARLTIDLALAVRSTERADRWRAAVQGQAVERPTLDQLESELLPVNDSEDLGVLRLLRHVLTEARERRVSPAFILMQPFREEAWGPFLKLQWIQRSALHLGILGTFIGLFAALAALDLSSGSLSSGAVASIVESLQVAFGTSVAGIEVSLMIGLLLDGLTRRRERYFRAMEEAVLSVRSLARQAIQQDEVLSELSEVGTAVRQLSDRILAQASQTEHQTRAIESGMKHLGAAKSDLDRFVETLGAEHRAFLTDVREIYDRLSPSRIGEELHDRLQEAALRISGPLEKGVGGLASGLASASAPLTRVGDTLTRIESLLSIQAGLLTQSTDLLAKYQAGPSPNLSAGFAPLLAEIRALRMESAAPPWRRWFTWLWPNASRTT